MSVKIQGIQFYTVLEVAAELQISSMTVRSYIKDGRLTAKKLGRRYLITDTDIKKFIGKL